ncbi:MAG: hypothetical protein ABSC02_01760 [Acidobacteriota bacterium]
MWRRSIFKTGVVMIAFADWFPLLLLGGLFTTVGLLKVYGFRHNIIGGGSKPWSTRLPGSCPTWSKHLNITMTVLFLVIGLSFLSILGWLLLTTARR